MLKKKRKNLTWACNHVKKKQRKFNMIKNLLLFGHIWLYLDIYVYIQIDTHDKTTQTQSKTTIPLWDQQ